MKVVGVVAEYNPFHAGHAYHLAEAKRASGAEYAVAVMSGAVTQRGTFARHDLSLRAEMALKGGADAVFLLPVRFSCAPAEDFARGGVSLLAATGVVTHLSFGCEKEALPLLSPLSRLLAEEPPVFSAALRRNLDAGCSFPKARALACGEALGIPGLAERMESPNLTLALEYLRALPAGAVPVPIAREGAGYAEESLSAEYPSALAIRRALSERRQDTGEGEAALRAALPCADEVFAAEEAGEVHGEESLAPALLALLRTADRELLSRIRGMDEGLEARFLEAARQAGTREELLSLIKTKRYTRARLSRAATNVLLGVTKEFAAANPSPTYLRLLGFREDARPLLHEIRRRASLPVVAKCADYKASDPLFALDLRARDLWALGAKNPAARAAGADFRISPVITASSKLSGGEGFHAPVRDRGRR